MGFPRNNPLQIPALFCSTCSNQLRLVIEKFANRMAAPQRIVAYCDTCKYGLEPQAPIVAGTIVPWKAPEEELPKVTAEATSPAEVIAVEISDELTAKIDQLVDARVKAALAETFGESKENTDAAGQAGSHPEAGIDSANPSEPGSTGDGSRGTDPADTGTEPSGDAGKPSGSAATGVHGGNRRRSGANSARS